MGMDVVLRVQCDGCDEDTTYIELYSDSSDSYRSGDLFEKARELDGWYFWDTNTYICNHCFSLCTGSWLCTLSMEQIESGNISHDELVGVIDSYPDPDAEDFPDNFCIPANLDLSDEMIESIASNIKGEMFIPGLTQLSATAADSLSKHEGYLELDGLKSLSDEAAESLSNHDGGLSLAGLTLLPDPVAESLGKSKSLLCLNGLTQVSDAAAESLSKNEGSLVLNGLTELSDAAAESLSKCESLLCLNGLTQLSAGAAECLGKHQGDCLRLQGLIELSDAVAESLGKYKGELDLYGLTHLSDAAAQSLSEKDAATLEICLDNLPASAAQILRDAGHGED